MTVSASGTTHTLVGIVDARLERPDGLVGSSAKLPLEGDSLSTGIPRAGGIPKPDQVEFYQTNQDSAHSAIRRVMTISMRVICKSSGVLTCLVSFTFLGSAACQSIYCVLAKPCFVMGCLNAC